MEQSASFYSVRLKWHAAFARLRVKAAQLSLVFKTGFDPTQPRVPAGNPDGGQWTSMGGGSSGGTGQILSDANPDNLQKPGARLAQAGPRRPFARQVRIGGRLHTLTPGQATRHAAAAGRARASLDRVRDIDPNWKPRPGVVATVEGQIRQLTAEAREAQARLREFTLQSPAQRFETYRALNNSRDLFGNETWPRGRDVVSTTTIDGIPYVGTNSNAPTYTARDGRTGRIVVDTLIARHPDVMNRRQIGRAPNNAVFHAEATVLLRAARVNGGSLAGKRFEVHTERNMCGNCREVLPLLGQELGNPTVTFVGPTGIRRTMRDGKWLK